MSSCFSIERSLSYFSVRKYEQSRVTAISIHRSCSLSLILSIVAICLGTLYFIFEEKNKIPIAFDRLPESILRYHVLNVHRHQNRRNTPTHYPREIKYDICPFSLFLYRSNLDERYRSIQAFFSPLTMECKKAEWM